jgi:hypothetical protein
VSESLFTKDAKHPRQPIGIAPDGIVRFKPNALLRLLVDGGHINLNVVILRAQESRIPDEDLAQFWQLLGTSISAFGEHDFVSSEEAEACDDEAARVIAEKEKLENG